MHYSQNKSNHRKSLNELLCNWHIANDQSWNCENNHGKIYNILQFVLSFLWNIQVQKLEIETDKNLKDHNLLRTLNVKDCRL